MRAMRRLGTVTRGQWRRHHSGEGRQAAEHFCFSSSFAFYACAAMLLCMARARSSPSPKAQRLPAKRCLSLTHSFAPAQRSALDVLEGSFLRLADRASDARQQVPRPFLLFAHTKRLPARTASAAELLQTAHTSFTKVLRALRAAVSSVDA